MNRRRSYLLLGTLMLAGILAGCGPAPPGAENPFTLPPDVPTSETAPPTTGATTLPIVTAAEGALATPPSALLQAGATLQVSGRLLRPDPAGMPVLQTFLPGSAAGRPVERRLTLTDAQSHLPAASATSGSWLTLTGAFTPGTGGGIELGTLVVQQVAPLTLDAAQLTQAADAALRAAAPALAATPDYPHLALPDFTAVTATWKPQAADFQSGGSILLGVTPDGAPIAHWHGAPLPAHPDRPQVTRWPAVYTTFQGMTVTTLLVTIEGQVAE
jgi:hypothetical protein